MRAHAMPAHSIVVPPLGGPAFAIGGVLAAGTLVLDVLNSPVFAKSLQGIVALGFFSLAVWETRKNRRAKQQDEMLRSQAAMIANLQSLETKNHDVIKGLLRDNELGKVERESMALRLDKTSLDLAQAKLEILRNKGVVSYSGQRIPVRPIAPPSRINILLVEDDESTRRCFVKVIGHYGYQITATESVAEALDQIRKRERVGPKFDFAILDLILPDGSGLDVLGELHASSPQTEVIVISGSIDEVVLAKTQSEAVAFLVKPVEFTELLAMLGCADGDHAPLENSRP